MPISLFRSRTVFHIIIALAVFVFSAGAGISFAAWLDAPGAPPNYGAVGCSPKPCEEEDFKPMNLSTTSQTKRAGVIFEGAVNAYDFVDGNSPYFTDITQPKYHLDLANSGEAGLIKGSVG
ncbi:MAG: hypothetical protein NUV61_02315, partial [Candidatus Azambacteria bacterium]|nr:hypothetical protein [Candidatus Azambacteria bacterium]